MPFSNERDLEIYFVQPLLALLGDQYPRDIQNAPKFDAPEVLVGRKRKPVVYPDHLVLAQGGPAFVVDAKHPARPLGSEDLGQILSYALHPDVQVPLVLLTNATPRAPPPAALRPAAAERDPERQRRPPAARAGRWLTSATPPTIPPSTPRCFPARSVPPRLAFARLEKARSLVFRPEVALEGTPNPGAVGIPAEMLRKVTGFQATVGPGMEATEIGDVGGEDRESGLRRPVALRKQKQVGKKCLQSLTE